MINLPPIYSETYHLALSLLQQSAQLPKTYRPTLGRKMELAAIECVVLMRQILLTKGPASLNPILDRIDELKVLVQLSYDLKLLSHHRFAELIKSLECIGKMAGALNKQQNSKTPKGPIKASAGKNVD